MDVTVMLEPEVDLPRVAALLDGLGHEGRVHTVRTWTKKLQATLFEAAKGHLPIDLDFLVPSSVAPLVEVIHDGQNTLPAFRHFQKRFAKLEEGAVELVGYNHQAMSAFTGPGYFVVTRGEGDQRGELLIDYTKTPQRKPPTWPSLRANSGIGGLVYGGMIDHLRGISSHVSIGRAYRGKAVDAWFALVRRDPTP